MSEHPGFCLACFMPLPAEADICPVCGARMAELSKRNYREKLTHALLHPLADIRMRAIIALGLRGEPETADALVACALRHPTDVVQGMEIIHSLDQMKDATVRQAALSTVQAQHHAHAVREGAARALAMLPQRGEADA
ncbi:MAG TPA: HEAT repeat domain-containing protein [Gallionella sp.]|nr:HEAT repeat domain-containing protein [Gallionella sp.]HUW75085.1 HEAT repeat domain-containing protein [Gallionella sp.]